jgi:hypothetical protein
MVTGRKCLIAMPPPSHFFHGTFQLEETFEMTLRRRILLSIGVMMLGIFPLMAANITYTVNGKLGPVLSGSDPLGANGQSTTITVTASSTLNPTTTGTSSATYTLPPGAVTVAIGGTTYASKGNSILKYTVPLLGKDTMVVTSTIAIEGVHAMVSATVSLASGSFILKAVQRHPETFAPSPQSLSAASRAGGSGSQVSYTMPVTGTTTLGLAGAASN